MRTIKASLRINKNGRLFCSVHQTYRVSKAPRNGCKICWTIFENLSKQTELDKFIEQIKVLTGQK